MFEDGFEMLMLIFNVVYVLVVVVMIVFILMQCGFGVVVGLGFGVGVLGIVFGVCGVFNFLFKLIKWLVVVFFGISFFMVWYVSYGLCLVVQQDLGLMLVLVESVLVVLVGELLVVLKVLVVFVQILVQQLVLQVIVLVEVGVKIFGEEKFLEGIQNC